MTKTKWPSRGSGLSLPKWSPLLLPTGGTPFFLPTAGYSSASALTTFLKSSEGEYALVTEKTADGAWGKTYRYGKWGWVKLSYFTGGARYTAGAGTHLFGGWTVAEEANCQHDGREVRTCTRCGYQESRVLKGGHVIDPKATCLEYGVCSICKLKVENPLGHDWDEGTVTVQPACLEPGVKTFVCKRDASHVRTEEVPALGHDYVISDIGDPDRSGYLVIGDSPSSDIDGAINSGIDCCWYDRRGVGDCGRITTYTVTNITDTEAVLQ